MTTRGPFWDAAVRLVEVALIFATVVLMFLGYRMQHKTSEMQVRPYLHFPPDFLAVQKAKDDPAGGLAWSVQVKNAGSSPAVGVNYSIFVMADGQLVQSVHAHPGATRSEDDCAAAPAEHRVPFHPGEPVCVEREAMSVAPGGVLPLAFEMTALDFQKLLDASDKGRTSGVFVNVTYGGLQKASGPYAAQVAVLPYSLSPGRPLRWKMLSSQLQ